MECNLCGNSNPKLFFELNNRLYCRVCIKFKGEKYEAENVNVPKQIINLKYPLTTSQEKVADEILNNIKSSKRILVNAVCGAGKTEIVTKVIKLYLDQNKRVGIVIPRKDLVVEIGNRMKQIFTNAKVVFVYGNHHDDLNGDIVVLTAHQAYRYQKCFELLIIDEIDAFPYAGNEALKNIVLNTSLGSIVSLSATPSEEDIAMNHVLNLNRRYHEQDLPVPRLFKGDLTFCFIKLLTLLKKYKKAHKKCFIYVPTIQSGLNLYRVLKVFFPSVINISSKSNNRDKIIQDIRDNIYSFVITTTILERGVTFKGLQVIVFMAENSIFDKKTLIQIAGRVGRNIRETNGDVYFLARKQTEDIKSAIQTISRTNNM
jgi:competence protein ComFA